MKSKLSVLYSRASVGISAPLVSVETHVSHGMPGFTIVGLPETAVKESKERVRSAILNSGLQFTNRKIIINLAPADLPKEGGRFDLPIAIGILAATGQLKSTSLQHFEFAGELALTGNLRPISGIIPFAMATKKAGRNLIIPKENFFQANLIGDNLAYPAANLLEVYNHLLKTNIIDPTNYLTNFSSNLSTETITSNINNLDISDIEGQPHAKRALEITAAGGHNLLMVGPPGTGKTMLASRLPSIMAELSTEQALEVSAIYSLKGMEREHCWKTRPFRNPHHTVSSAALVGGGSIPKPGEISLAHNGVLFLDELPEFSRYVLEVLREPMESGKIVIARAKQQIELPARFQLVAAMNPCPCGNRGNPNIKCQCSQDKIKKYLSKLSGPLLDRIDICIEVPNVPTELLTNSKPVSNSNNTYNSLLIRKNIEFASQIQLSRQNKLNAHLNNKMIKNYCELNEENNNLMQLAIKKLKLSARSYYRILKVARTIADLTASDQINTQQLQEAISFHKLPILDHGFADC